MQKILSLIVNHELIIITLLLTEIDKINILNNLMVYKLHEFLK
jgi:hypothetical protein